MDSQKPKKRYYRLCLTLDIYNGKRTEWSPTRFVIIRVIKKTRRPEAEDPFVNHEYDYGQNWTTQSPVTKKS